ncbi:hypothetical protein HPCU_02190 [Helicobacter pylori Cuz20]|uniref:Uncharacterized protein n=2 Tax=Helicobacter pylori TaxID=210 RepID=A0A0E0WCN4_HELPX|nr:hypothetical protein [Helicobacter pylori]ADO03611.1 hypothetical protein HPCU_02190 [Helicobacter pylori Cuz20]AFH97527.1 hypothetical protein HPSH417_01870 [Helicobacter pylori Shi417]AFH99110.1 hypothetical protein HPSH169_02050 [Helicobacter pylori Shi169]QQW90490.1 hypothetical protein HG564_01945 [Helicobacter pylori]
MKIKAIMLGLVVSGGLLLANGEQDAYNFKAMEKEIKEITKMIITTGEAVKMNEKQFDQLNADIYTLVSNVAVIAKRLKKLEQELAQLKQAKK